MSSDADPLVLVAGLNCTEELYAAQIGALAAGRTITVADHRSDDDLGAMAQRLLAAAPARFALCGLSMGGYLAFEVMRRAPARVTRLALLDTSAKPATPENNLPREQMIDLAAKGAFDNVVTLLWQRLVAPARLTDEPLRQRVKAMAEAVGPEGFIRQQRAIMGRPDSRPGLAAVAVPTLVLVGTDDQITPPDEAREIVAGIGRNAEMVALPGVGHLSALEAPGAVTDALKDWLAR